ncbi:unnamed protein product [Rotaria sordida]|uniref:Uncharacterized protein n=1 Tax=Rotaria sordida TaxID=392033 RepID=A0A818NDZ8_9BILA|nr:unnamed protein product [Rotaria sordida]
MAFSNLFRRYSTTNDVQTASYAYMEGNSIAETLLEELESQCRNSLTLGSSQNKRDSDTLSSSVNGSLLSTHHLSTGATSSQRHSSVDYSWLSPTEDCTLIITQFRRNIRAQTKLSTPENIIALFRKTISDYIDQKPRSRSNTNSINDTINSNIKSNNKCSSNIYSLVRNNRINPKCQLDDEQHCIAELAEISITSSSNEGTENNHHRSFAHT